MYHSVFVRVFHLTLNKIIKAFNLLLKDISSSKWRTDFNSFSVDPSATLESKDIIIYTFKGEITIFISVLIKDNRLYDIKHKLEIRKLKAYKIS